MTYGTAGPTINVSEGACQGPCGLMDKALVFGTKDCRFESCQGHLCIHRLVAMAVGSVALATHALVHIAPRG